MNAKALSRTPPVGVRKRLRQEVGFGCPVDSCGSPYLEWHHFDPPWEIEKHHDPARMIALCSEHHAKADAWTKHDLREMKSKASADRDAVRGRFEWMADEVLTVMGGSIFVGTRTPIKLDDRTVFGYERDHRGRLQLSLAIGQLSAKGDLKTRVDKNDFIIGDEADDVECPPNGKLLKIRWSNGDRLSVEFKRWTNRELFQKYPQLWRVPDQYRAFLVLPLLTCDVQFELAGTPWKITPSESLWPFLKDKRGIYVTAALRMRSDGGGSLVFEKPSAPKKGAAFWGR